MNWKRALAWIWQVALPIALQAEKPEEPSSVPPAPSVVPPPAPTVIVPPPQPPPPSPPIQPWKGWSLENIFEPWVMSDLNPLAAATGIPRDELAITRDAYLDKLIVAYQVANGTRKVNGSTYSVWSEDRFRVWCRTGVLEG